MGIVDEDASMRILRAANQLLISHEIALLIAEKVFSEVYGEGPTRLQCPLLISDGGDRWEICGGSKVPFQGFANPNGGNFQMTIMKMDGRIRKLTRAMALPP